MAERETLKSLEGFRSSKYSVGDPVKACEAASERALGLGYNPTILSSVIDGEAKDVGICFAGIVKEIVRRSRPFAPPCALISGGETTVAIGSESGRGGPNQETALGFAFGFTDVGDLAFAAVDTDGTDGPTEIAGGIVDALTQRRAAELGVDLEEALKRHNSSEAFEQLGDAIITGHTGTNVMNLRVIVIR
jgi:glycerate-2-kinase